MVYVTLSHDRQLRFWTEDKEDQDKEHEEKPEPIKLVWLINRWGAGLMHPVYAFEWVPED